MPAKKSTKLYKLSYFFSIFGLLLVAGGFTGVFLDSKKYTEQVVELEINAINPDALQVEQAVNPLVAVAIPNKNIQIEFDEAQFLPGIKNEKVRLISKENATNFIEFGSFDTDKVNNLTIHSYFRQKYPGLKINSKQNYLQFEFTSVNKQKQPTTNYVYLSYKAYNKNVYYILTNNEAYINTGESILNSINTKQQGVQTPTQVLGVNDALNTQLGPTLARASVTRAYANMCVKAKFKVDPDLPNSSKKTYNICIPGLGSAFFVNKNGYLVTNAHVVQLNPIDVIISSGYILDSGVQDDGFWDDFMLDIANILYQYDPTLATLSIDEQVFYLVAASSEAILGIYEEGGITMLPNSQVYVESDAGFKFGEGYDLINKNENIATNIIKANSIESLYKSSLQQTQFEGVKTPDLALLKVKEPTFLEYPSLKFANEKTLATGQKVFAAGFPGKADDQLIFSLASSSVPTITEGSISAIKSSTNNAFNLVQIDASISHGNSGGPIVNSNGELVAVSTYVLGTTNTGKEGDFNAGVSVEEVKSLMEGEGVLNDTGEFNQNLRQAISYANQKYYKYSLKHINKIKELYPPVASTIKPVEELAKASVGTKNDSSPLFIINNQYEIRREKLAIAILGGVFIVIGLVLFVIHLIKSNKSVAHIAAEQMTNQASLASATGSPIKANASNTATHPIKPYKPQMGNSINTQNINDAITDNDVNNTTTKSQKISTNTHKMSLADTNPNQNEKTPNQQQNPNNENTQNNAIKNGTSL